MFIARLQDAETTSGLVRFAEPWSQLYAHSKGVSAAVLFLHLLPLLVAGGAALAADRATLRAARGTATDRARQLGELAAAHRFVVSGLALSLASGIMLFLADVKTFLPSPFLWIKLALVALLLANGLVMTRTERALASAEASAPLWSRMRRLSIWSVTLWLATTLAGVVLSTYA